MTRNLLNFLIDGLTAIVMLGMISTGLLVRFVLPPGTGGRMSVWGWGRHDWGEFHFWLAVSLGVMLVLHVTLHWSWVCGTVHRMVTRGPARTARTRPWQRHVAGGAFLAAIVLLVGGFVWVAAQNVNGRNDGRRRGPRAAEASMIAPSDDAASLDSGNGAQRRRRGGR